MKLFVKCSLCKSLVLGVAFSIVLLISCNQNDNKIAINVSKLDEAKWDVKIYDENNVKLSFILFKDCDNILGELSDVRCFGNRIVLYEKERDLLFLYDNKGSYITSIGKQGNGPNEYDRITAFDEYTDENGTVIELFDYTKNRIQAFDDLGNLKYEKYLPKKMNAFSFVHTKDGYYFYTPVHENGKDNYMLVRCSSDLKSIKAEYILDNVNLIPSQDKNFTKNKNGIFFHYGLNDTIYKINEGGVEPFICIDFGKRKVPLERIASVTSIRELNDILYFSDNTFVGKMNSLISNDNTLMYRFSDIAVNKQVLSYYGVYDFDKNKSLFYKFIVTKLPVSFSIIQMKDNYAIGIINPYLLNSKALSYLNDVYGLKVGDQTNPMLLKIYEK